MVSIGSAIKAGVSPKKATAAKRPGSANPPLVTPPANRVQLPSVPANSPNSGSATAPTPLKFNSGSYNPKPNVPKATTATRKTNNGTGQVGSNATGSYSLSGGTDFGSTGGVVDPAMGADVQAAQPPVISEDEYLANEDGVYTAQMAALDAAFNSLNTDLDAQDQNYTTTYNKNLKDLGWDGQGWSMDPMTAYGSAFTSNKNDFAARGLFDSSGYADSRENLDRNFLDQRTGMETAKQQFGSDIIRQREAGTADKGANAARAKADALARYQALYGL